MAYTCSSLCCCGAGGLWLACGGVAHVINCCSLPLESACGLSSNLLWLYVCRSSAVLVLLFNSVLKTVVAMFILGELRKIANE